MSGDPPERVRMPSPGTGENVPRAAPGRADRLFRVDARDLSGDTSQTSGMRRVEALSARSVGSTGIWMGQTHVAPATSSGVHHHGESETGIFVLTGNPEFTYRRDGEVISLRTSPGDYIYVPPWVPHQEINPDSEDEAVVVIARSTQQAIVVNLGEVWDHVR